MTNDNKEIMQQPVVDISGVDIVPNMAKGRIGIIQLSDLQFGAKHEFGSPSEIAESLLYDIDEMAIQYKFKPSFIVLSGDITETGDTDEFGEAKDVILGISRHLKINYENILCVPGNHDVNRPLSEQFGDTENGQVKLKDYREYVSNIANSQDVAATDRYPKIKYDIKVQPEDISFPIEFLLLNSCEKETHLVHKAYVEKSKLIKSLPSRLSNERLLKIAILHHRLHTNNGHERPVENSNDITAILNSHKYDIVLTGHIHYADVLKIENPNGNKMIYAGSGASGADYEGRVPGVPNQYSIHVIDIYDKKFQSLWRAFNCKRQSIYGEGAWVEDTTFHENPTEFTLQNQ